jgi:hypothetical protein
MDKPELLRAMRDAHAPIAAAAAALSDADLLAQAPGMPGWTRKDVLAHIEWWHRHSTAVLEGVGTGVDPFPDTGEPFDLDARNARTLDEGRARACDDVRRGEAASFQELVEAVEGASDEALFGVGAVPWLGDQPASTVLAGDTWDHYPEHLLHLATG